MDAGAFEEQVEKTNAESTKFKACVVKLGYYNDPFVRLFVPDELDSHACTAEMSRGYYIRVRGVRTMVDRFVDAFQPNGQILNMGAGCDTLYWNLLHKGKVVKCFVEVDTETVFKKKSAVIKRAKNILYAGLENAEVDIFNGRLQIGHYSLLASDLRMANELGKHLFNVEQLSRAGAVMIIFECVLMYMDKVDCCKLLTFLATTFSNALLLCYEPIGADKFIDVFQENMNRRGLPVPGLKNFADQNDLVETLHSCGWHSVQTRLANDFFKINISSTNAERIARIQPLVEPEVLSQLLDHYTFVLAKTGTCQKMASINFDP